MKEFIKFQLSKLIISTIIAIPIALLSSVVSVKLKGNPSHYIDFNAFFIVFGILLILNWCLCSWAKVKNKNNLITTIICFTGTFVLFVLYSFLRSLL